MIMMVFRKSQALASLFVVLSFAMSAAEPTKGKAGPPAGVVTAYQKACEATRLKYFPGLVSFRSPDFKAFAMDGRELNTLDEARKLNALLTRALSASEEAHVLSAERRTEGEVVCRVRDLVELTYYGEKNTLRTVTITTESRDSWKHTPLGWRQTRSHIISQRLEYDELGQQE